MAQVYELIPGDEVINTGHSAVFIARAQHPIWPRLMLVIWRMPDGTVSLDALSPIQHVGELIMRGPEGRTQRLRQAMIGSDPR